MPAASSSLLPVGAGSLAGFQARGGYTALALSRADVAEARNELAGTSLTGLGGAHFPFAKKLLLTLDSPGPRAVVCNAAEDEPGSLKDRALLERNPHLVIEGALIAAAALDASIVYLYVSETSQPAIASLRRAVSELPEGVQGGVEFRLVMAPTAYVAGEATAAIEVIEGRPAKPQLQPPFPAERGVGGMPTLVSNCETLANLPRILAHRYTTDLPVLSRLATVTGDVLRPGVYEIDPERTTFGDLINLAGGLSDPSLKLKAIQPGGPSSAYLPATAADVFLSDDAIRAAGSQPGCLAVRILSTERCLVEELAEITAFFAKEQCGQCPGCRMKTQTYAKLVQQVRDGHGTWSVVDQFATVDDFVADLPRRCALISMPTPPVVSALKHFRDDFASHIEQSASHDTGHPDRAC